MANRSLVGFMAGGVLLAGICTALELAHIAEVNRYIKVLEMPGSESDYETSESFAARDYIEHSSDPRAIAFMTKQLVDPKANNILKEAAYDYLAGTGDEGARAVIAQRTKREPLPSLEKRMGIGPDSGSADQREAIILDEKTGSDGRTWGLLQSGVLGNRGDLWLAEKVSGHWVHPLFAGVFKADRPAWNKVPQQPPPKMGGRTGTELAQKASLGAWFKAIVGNPELTRDLDESGLTGLEKKRLGLPLHVKDSDGDGDPDDVDPCPNAAVRHLSDSEQILAAAFEARFHFYKSTSPAIFIAPTDMKPFEMVGWHAPVLWRTADREEAKFSSQLGRCYDRGVVFIEFKELGSRGKDAADRFIRWNEDRTVATVDIDTEYGFDNAVGYELTLRNFEGTWVVTSKGMNWVT